MSGAVNLVDKGQIDETKMAASINADKTALTNLYNQHITELTQEIAKKASAANYDARGLAYLRLHQYQKAKDDFAQAVQLDPKYATGYNHLGYANNLLGDHEAAIDSFLKAHEFHPGISADNLAHCVEISRAKKKAEAAKSQGQTLSAAEENDQGVILLKYARSKADFETAKTHFTNAITKAESANPKDTNLAAHAYNNRGHVHIQLNDFEQAVQDCQKALQMDGAISSDNLNTASTYLLIGQVTDQIEAAATAELHNLRGFYFTRLSLWDKAKDDFAKAIALDQNHAHAHNNMAYIHMTMGQLQEAEASARKALSLDKTIDQANLDHIQTLLKTTDILQVVQPHSNWSDMKPAHAPSIRFEQGIGHLGQGKVLLFGGTNDWPNDETWVYDAGANDWSQITSGAVPKARSQTAIAYIGPNKALMFGGNKGTMDRTPPCLNDTWLFDGSTNTWQQLQPASPPPARRIHQMAYLADGKVLLFGGLHGQILGDTWLFDLNTTSWTQLNLPSAPPPRNYFSLAHLDSQRALLFGGSPSGDQDAKLFDDTWLFDLNSQQWTKLQPATSPPTLMGASMAFLDQGHVLLFSGRLANYGNLASNTWAFDMSTGNWKELNWVTAPAARQNSSAAFLAPTKAVLFGNVSSDNSTWVFQNKE